MGHTVTDEVIQSFEYEITLFALKIINDKEMRNFILHRSIFKFLFWTTIFTSFHMKICPLREGNDPHTTHKETKVHY